MKPITREEALNLVREANTLTRDDISVLQKVRLRELVAHARKNSTLYREKYKDLPENPALEDLPVMTKQELTSNMQKLVCDSEFSEEELQAYIADLDNLGIPFMGKYSVSTTSGTTGEPLRMLRDSRHVAINGSILQVRLFESPQFKDFPGMMDKYVRFASVLAGGGFHAAFMAFEGRRKMLEAEGITGNMLLLEIDDPVAEMVRKLNEFQPEVITGYPSVMYILAGEQKEGRLKISPKAILCSAEQLTDEMRIVIEHELGCPVGNVFCSTEGGEVAILCSHGHMHLNTDWIIVEPIDKEGNPVPAGEMSAAMLVTNLTNGVQPIIRYRVDDSVIVHEQHCACGLPFPYVEILGRTDDLPEFSCANGFVRFSPIVFSSAVMDIPGISVYQFVQTGQESLTVRIGYLDGAIPEKVDREIHDAVSNVFSQNKLDHISFSIVRGAPVRAKKGKKMRSYLKTF
ncbi:phenylacetate--CoA ligase family protein [Maridesulfovibrio sp.]|uniref:phenylacetate--CoA ligase family protein n=1 Tax=Maridesulfovibrio sp. TaxID=2795000 RepID=UPI0039F0CE42